MKDIAAFKALGIPQENFRFSAIVDESAHLVLDTAPLQDFLNRQLVLSHYGSIKHIDFTPIAIQGDDRHQSISYNVDEASISISLQLDYTQVEEAPTKAAMTALLAGYFLAAVPLFAKIPVPGFQITAFRKDLLALFEKKSWLEEPFPEITSPPVYLVWSSDFRGAAPEGQPSCIYARKVARREWFDAIDLEEFLKRLHQRINLTRYGQSVEELYLTFLADEPAGKSAPADSTYFRADRELHLSIPLGPPPYDRQALLRALVGVLPEIKRWNIADFDWKQFREECLVE